MARVYYDGYGNDGGQVIVPRMGIQNSNENYSYDENSNTEKSSAYNEDLTSYNEDNTSFENTKIANGINSNISLPFGLDGLLPNFALDDIILLGIVLVMLHDGAEDKTLLVIIGIIFLLGFNEV